MRILVILFHTTRAFTRFLTTTRKSSSNADIKLRRYLQEVIIYRRRPYAMKALDATNLYSFIAKLRNFRFSTLLYYVVR